MALAQEVEADLVVVGPEAPLVAGVANALRDKGSLYTSMRKLTNMFELHWYGFMPAAEADWDEFRNGYKKIVRE